MIERKYDVKGVESKLKELVKGELDWHETLNDNFNELNSSAGQAATDIQEHATRLTSLESGQSALETEVETKQDKATDPKDLGAGYLYQQSDGSVVLAEATPKFKYTVIVDNGADGNPAAVEYADDAVGMTPANGSNLGSWGDTVLLKEYFRPCVIGAREDTPRYYLNPNNLKQKLDGSPSVLTGGDGDVMIQVKKLYGKFTKLENNKVAISISNVREDGSWFCWNEVNGVEVEYRYRGRYVGGYYSGITTVIRSISGVPKAVSKNIDEFRTLVNARGKKYYQNDIFLNFLWQAMFLLMYKNRDSQASLGWGFCSTDNTASVPCGWSDNYGCCFGEKNGKKGVVFLWTEDVYGDLWQYVDGIVGLSGAYLLTRYPSKYGDSDNYELAFNHNLKKENDNLQYVVSLAMTNDIQFLPTSTGGSSQTFWCDCTFVEDGIRPVAYGGAWSSGFASGMFEYDMWVSGPSSLWIGTRLCRN